MSIFHNLGQMRCPENQYLSENASSCKSCFWNFCNFVCLADFPVYCPFSQQPTWFWIFFLFVVARIFLYFWKFCVFRGYFCLFLILKLSCVWTMSLFIVSSRNDYLGALGICFCYLLFKGFCFWNFCVFGRLDCLDFPVYCLNPRQPANVVTWWTNKHKLASTWIYIFCAQSNFGHETGRDMQKCISKNGNTLITLGILSIYRGGWVVYILLHI